jgi:hypothetical protein
MLLNAINCLKTPAREALLGLYDELSEAIWIPNSVLPHAEHGQKEWEMDGTASAGKIYGRTASDLQKSTKSKPLSEAAQTQAGKDERIQSYINREAEGIDFIEDEDRLYRNQVTFCKLMLDNGVFSEEDFEEIE